MKPSLSARIPRFARIGLLVVGLTFAVLSAGAAYLRNVPQTVHQPDGAVVQCLASGDEYYNWLHDKDGYTIVQDPRSGYYVFAVRDREGGVAPSPYIVGRADPAALGLEKSVLVPSAVRAEIQARSIFLRDDPTPNPAPRMGVINNIVIFIRFSGESEFSDPVSLYNDMFNATAAGANSMFNYFLEASYNSLAIFSRLYPTASTTVLSYQDAQPRGYYQPYNASTNPIGYTGGDGGTDRRDREHTLLVNAVLAVRSQIPSSLAVDGDNDGRVDNVCFIVSGSPTGWSSLLWPHQWSLYSQVVTINSKRVYTYNFQLRTSLQSSGVGVLCHEMFHSLGAPDLYHYSYDGLHPVWRWDLMESDLNPPQHMGAFMKFRYGTWIASLPEIIAPGTYTLQPLTSATNNAYKIRSPNSTTEYFVVEYRRKSGVFETSLPGEGLLVYRINSGRDGLGNASGPPDEVYLYRPGGTPTADGAPANAHFSSATGRTAIHDGTNPSSFLSTGAAGGLYITNIGAAGSTISFQVSIGDITLSPPVLVSPANGVSGQTPPVNLQWQDTNTSPQESGYNVRIRPSGGAYSYYSAAANVTFYAPPGLLAGRTYSWNVQAVGNGTITNDSAWANGGADWAFTTAAGETISTPNGPSGPTTGSKHTSYTYTTGGSTTSLGHAVQYWIDWGDGGGTGWLAAGTTSADHAWTADGTFLVKAKSRCAVDPALESPWSTALSVQIGSGRRVLIVDLDKNLNSGPALKSAVEANGKATLYQTTWPSSIEVSAYDAVFACLGVYPNNHALTSAEGAALKTYLDGGGRLYLEGGDTWAYDPQTTVHSYFGISGLSDGGQDTGSVTGSGIMAGRSFSYAGDNNWMDRLDVAPGAAGASVIWDNQSPAYHNGILRSGSNFRTIGVSFEFGGIPAASRNSVMGGYLAFLEGISTSGGKRVFGDFGPLGIWVWDNTSWTLLNDSNPEAIVPANTDGDTDDELFLDLGASGLWLWNGGSLGPLTTDNPEADVAGDFDGDGQDEAAADFGAKGLWLWNSSGWSQLSTENAEGIVAGNGDSDAADEAVADFGTKGLFLWNSGIWTLLSSDNAEGLTAADVDGDGYDEFVADFGTKGLWLWNNGEWLYLTSDNAQDFLGGDFDNDGRDELAVDFGGLGLWLWKNGAWSMLTGDNPQTLAVGQTDEDPMAELTADFGSLGLWQWNGSLWSQLTGDNPEAILLADSDNDGKDEIFGDFGALGVWRHRLGAWSRLSASNPEAIISRRR